MTFRTTERGDSATLSGFSVTTEVGGGNGASMNAFSSKIDDMCGANVIQQGALALFSVAGLQDIIYVTTHHQALNIQRQSHSPRLLQHKKNSQQRRKKFSCILHTPSSRLNTAHHMYPLFPAMHKGTSTAIANR